MPSKQYAEPVDHRRFQKRTRAERSNLLKQHRRGKQLHSNLEKAKLFLVLIIKKMLSHTSPGRGFPLPVG